MKSIAAVAGVLALTSTIFWTSAAEASSQSCRGFSEKGVHASAIAACSAVITGQSAAGTRAAALYYRANSYFSTREMTAARADIDASLNLQPNFAPALALRAALNSAAGNHQSAEADLSRAISLGFDDANAYAQRADANLALGNLSAAAADLGKVVAANPNDAISQLRLAITLNGLGRNGEALAAADRAIALNSDFADAYGVRAKIKDEMGDKSGALQDYAQAKSTAKFATLAPDANVQFRSLLGKADLLLKDKKFDEALAAANEALTLQPNDALAGLLKSDILQEAGRFSEARVALKALAPSAANALRSARLALNSNDTAGAMTDYDAALSMMPNMAAARFERGQLNLKAGKYAEAITDFDQALANDSSFVNRRAHYLRGKAKYRAGDLTGAIADFSADLAITQTADGFLWRALANSGLGNNDASLSDASSLLKLAPNQARSHAVRGDVLLKAGRLSEGKAAHEKALELDPDFAPSTLRLSELNAAE